MRAFVNVVGIHTHQGEQSDMPGQEIEPPGAGDKQTRENEEVSGAFPPTQLCKEAREMVMHDIGPNKQRPDDRGVFGKISIFNPMDGIGD